MEATLTLVLALLIHGRTIPAIVAAIRVDECTLLAWLHKAEAHAALLHDRMMVGMEAQQVHVDEIRVCVRGAPR